MTTINQPVRDLIKNIWTAVQELEDNARTQPESVRKSSIMNISKYLKSDIRMIGHQWGMTMEDLEA